MNLEVFRDFCLSLPSVTEEVKWQNNLCFMIGNKMFAIAILDESPTAISFKTNPKDFDALVGQPLFMPAPYLARYKWVTVKDIDTVPPQKLQHLVRQSYDMVKAKLHARIRKNLG